MNVKLSLREKFTKEYNRNLLEKWNKYISGVKKVYPQFGNVEAINLARACENLEEEMNKARRSRVMEATQPADVGPYVRHAFEIITGVLPNLVANEVVSVQTLNQKIGQIFFLRAVYGTTRGGATAGETAVGPYSINSHPAYTAEHIDNEVLGNTTATTSFEATLAYKALAGTVEILIGSDAVHDDGKGKIVGNNIAEGSTIDYESGAINITFTKATEADLVVVANYNISDLQTAPVDAPDYNLVVDERLVYAHARKLRARYAFDAAYDMEKQFGLDMDRVLLERSVNEIKHEIDQEILGDLLRQAGIDGKTWNMTPRTGVSVDEHYKSFLPYLNSLSNLIYKTSKRGRGNVIICGMNAATVIESLPGYVPNDDTDVAGAYVAGTIKGQYKVVKNPFYGDDDFVVLYKGDDFLDAGYVYAPYLPVFATQVIMLDDFMGRRGFATSYAKVMLNRNFYVRGKITHEADTVNIAGSIETTTPGVGG